MSTMQVQLLPESYCEQEKYDFRHVNLETQAITVHYLVDCHPWPLDVDRFAHYIALFVHYS